jgi:hypothetical protein
MNMKDIHIPAAAAGIAAAIENDLVFLKVERYS